jgi:hypothetical protein
MYPPLAGLLSRSLRWWLPVAAATTVLAGVVYVAVQQDIRSGADDPQVQLAEDARSRLEAGAAPESVLPPGPVDLRRSLAPYVVVFDTRGRPLASSGVLDGDTPVPPAGVLEHARGAGVDRISWEPAAGVRSAIVVLPYRDGFVLAGRSLRRVEERELALEVEVGLGWLVALGASAAAALLAALATAPRRSASI